MGMNLTRRAGLAAALAAPFVPHRAQAAGTANLVLESEALFLDPHFTTAAISRTFSTHVFDTLFATDEQGKAQPQMAEGHDRSADGLTWTIPLRGGLKWHDGAPVTAEDCVASLKRWAPRDSVGRLLLAATDAFEAKDPRTLVIRLKNPFPLVLETLGKPNALAPFIIPARLAAKPPEQRMSEVIGSGPFRFLPGEWRPGDSMVLERNPDYVPRAEPPSFLAGGKRVKLDRTVWKVMPDQATAAAALIANEIDYVQYTAFDWIDRLERTRGVELLGLGGPHMFQGNFRLNHAAPPFDDPAIRQVLWKLVDQTGIMQAIGVPDRFARNNCTSFWMCDAPLESKAGSDVFRFSVAEAKKELAATSYKGQPVIMMEVSGSISQTASMVLAQSLKDAGFTVDQQVMDWGTVLQRRARKEGWSMFSVYSNGFDMISPLTHFYTAASCADFPGWSCDQRIPKLMSDFASAPDQAARQRIADEIQRISFELAPSLMWGQFTIPASYRTHMKGLIRSSFPVFWEVEKTA